MTGTPVERRNLSRIRQERARRNQSMWQGLLLRLLCLLSIGFCAERTLRAQEQATPTSTVAQPTTAARKPNLIFIIADDLGYGDLGCYGQKTILTPQIDIMASGGMIFTDHYAGSPVCAPSRCALLSGKHTGHALVRGNSEVTFDSQEVTIAKLLKQAGYRTAIIGKWGAGAEAMPGHPEQCGFEEFFGYLQNAHAHNHFPDFLWKNSAQIPIRGNVVKVVGGGGVAIKRTQYAHDLLTAEAIGYVEKNKEVPFFLLLSFTIPHANNEAGLEGMEVPDDSPYSDKPWPQPQKNHAAMITRLDRSVGEIIDTLKRLQIDDDTLVMFSSDNGPHKEGGADPAFFQSAGEFKGYKRDMHEGGIRVPLIAYWPGKIAEGSKSNHICALWDLLPTACDLAGVAIPEGIDGISYYPTLAGKSDQQARHANLYWEFHEGGSRQGLRAGDWKLIRTIGGPVELYDLSQDPAEHKNVAAEHPEIVEKLSGQMDSSRAESNNYPLKPVVLKQSDRIEESRREIRRRNRVRIRRTSKFRRNESANICRGSGYDVAEFIAGHCAGSARIMDDLSLRAVDFRTIRYMSVSFSSHNRYCIACETTLR